MNNKCTHTFFNVGDKCDETEDGFMVKGTLRIIVACVYCGQVREMYPNGNIEVTKQHGDIKFTDKNPQS